MKIYLLLNWDNYEFARFSHTGTWSKETEYCESCEYSDQKLIDPLQIEWDPDSDVIGDFSWCGYSIIVLENVKNFLNSIGCECAFGKVEVQSPTEKLRGRKRVAFPYIGPELFWLIPTKTISADVKESEIEIDTECSKCSRTLYKFKMERLVVPKEEFGETRMFRIKQFEHSYATFLTEDTVKMITSHKLTNFFYREAGVIK